ncbi:MAG: repeat protein, partial [Planctomycetaceae bacterium]|nr:repeat protein [Planctomycetaceae bacterium]
HRDGGANDTTFSYNQGQVSVKNALGNTTVYSFDNRGFLLKVLNPLGNTVSYAYDLNLNLIKTTDAAGNTYANTYDAFGNVTSSTDALGHTVAYTYSRQHDRLVSVTDAKSNTTRYGYDGKGDLTSTTYENGTVASVAYDPIGNVESSTDQMGQVTQYTNDAAGNVLTEKFADGTQTTFKYDSHENLISATDASGATILAYDAGDRLTKITYPSGRYLQYTYDSAGRRTQMVDQTGFTVNYSYDILGNLSNLTDGINDLIVQYTYDIVGRLSREDHGNGTYVTYAYDAAGDLLHLVNYAPDGSVNSRFDYSYDSLGRRITESTVDGAWTYTYDAIGELTHAVFTSTNLSIANQDLVYAYDAAGNRTHTIINGVTTAYTANNMNEYTQVGDTHYTYDADGNQIAATDPLGTTSYTFDLQSRLIKVTGATGSWIYQYDALGNRVATTYGGIMTQYLVDQTGLGNVVATLNSSGGLMSHYVYGNALASQVTDNAAVYYDFDGTGSLVGVSTAGGTYSNSYAYSPFGQLIGSIESVSNTFTFDGKWGVQSDGAGLTFMRARYYRASEGEFISRDPLGVAGNGAGIYVFANSDPTDEVDPMGLNPMLLVPLIWLIVRLAPMEPELVDLTESKIEQVEESAVVAGEKAGELRIELEEFLEKTHLGHVVEDLEERAELAEASEGVAETYAALRAVPALVIRTGVLAAEGGGAFFAILLWPSSIGPEPPPSALFVPGGGSSSRSVTPAAPRDPNSTSGPSGFGTQAFVDSSSFLPYKINFENAPSASVPAQRVVITDQLDSRLDWNSFQWSSFTFGDNVIAIPPNTQNYQTTVPMTYNGVTFRVVISLTLNPATGVITAVFQSLNALIPGDPRSELPPSVLIGFLPPEDGTGRGNGSVSYSIRSKAGLPTGTQIRNVALVTFDQNYSTATNQVSETDPSQGTDPTKEALVTIDSGPPTAAMGPLPSTVSTGDFTISWSGQDDDGGSGVATYDIYVSTDGGDWMPLLVNTTSTSTTFHGIDGTTYQFAAVATDNVGQQELGVLSAEATTKVVIAVTGPTDITLSNSSVSENLPSGTTVGVFSTTDSNEGGTFTYSFVTGAGSEDNSSFSLDASGHLKAAASFDFETKGTYEIRVRTTDQANQTFDKQFTVTVTDINEVPAIPAGQSFSVMSNATTGTVINTVVATDPDTSGPNSTKTFSITGGDGTGAFSINSQTGQITEANAAALSALSGQVMTLQITDTDGGSPALSAVQNISITVTNAAPVLATPGPIATYIGKVKTPVKVFPTLSVTDSEGSATLASVVISLPLGAAKKNPDVVTLPGLSAIGTRADAVVSGRLQITVTLKPGATTAVVQTILDGMTFQTKGAGLKSLSRNFQVQVTDQSGLHSNVISQTVNVEKKAPKVKKPK